jgi:hypothetical protein
MPDAVKNARRGIKSANPFDPVPIDESRLRGPGKKAASSRIGSLTVGDVRYVFTQLRNAKSFDPSRTLWTGETFGSFSLNYLLQSSATAATGDKKAVKTSEPSSSTSAPSCS